MVLSHLPLPLLVLLLCTSPSQTSTHGPPPAVAAAGPILRGRPFVVVWNMPTSQCHKRYNVHLDLGDFDIVENRRQHFQGQKMTIFYRDRLGKYPYLSQDGRKVNGGIPQLGDVSAHLSLAATQVSGLLQPDFSGLAVIDWEEWRPLWGRNFGTKMEYRRLSKLLVRQERPELSERATTSLARQKFEESAREFMEETLRSAVRGRPRGHWGFYGFPDCFNKQRRETDTSYTGRCHKGTKRQNDRLSWLWNQSTALYPSVYLPQRLAGQTFNRGSIQKPLRRLLQTEFEEMAVKPVSVLITGANRGLGLEMVKQMLEAPHPVRKLFACCRDPDGARAEALQTLAKKHPNIISVVRLDADDLCSIKECAHQVGSLVGTGGLNLLINNAGILPRANLQDTSPEDMQKGFNTNVMGPMNIIKEFLPHLRAAVEVSEMPGMSCSKAAVVNISTLLASMEAVKQTYASFPAIAYRVSKAGLNMLTLCASEELKKDEILFSMLHPGWVRTDMGGEDAEIDAPESVRGMLSVIASLTEKQNGAFLDYRGKTVPW